MTHPDLLNLAKLLALDVLKAKNDSQLDGYQLVPGYLSDALNDLEKAIRSLRQAEIQADADRAIKSMKLVQVNNHSIISGGRHGRN